MRSFILFSTARSGSTTLTHILDRHPQLTCWDEPFNPDSGKSRSSEVSDAASLAATLDAILFESVGLKHVAGPGGWPFSRWIADSRALNRYLLAREEHNVVFLTRSNLFERAVSVEIAQQTGVWHYWTQAHRDRVGQQTFRDIDIDVMRRRMDLDRRFIAECRSLLGKRANPAFEVAYEDLFGSSVSADEQLALLNGLLGYLGVDLAQGQLVPWIQTLLDPSTSLTAFNSRSLYRLIPNYEAAKQALDADDSAEGMDA